MLDIRTPIGILFALVGALLTSYGCVNPAASCHQALGHNVNLMWGAGMLVFGLVMLGWQWVAPEGHPTKEPASEPEREPIAP